MTVDPASLMTRWPQCGRVMSVEPVAESGFSGARVYRVRTDKGEFALRRWPTDSLSRARIRELHRFLNFLQQSGIEFVAVPRADETGETVVSIRGHQWQLEPWMAGSAISRHPSPAQLSNAIRALARLHLAAALYVPTDSGRPWFFQNPACESPAVIERLRMIRDWGEDRLRVIVAGGDRFPEFATEFPQFYATLAPTIARRLELCASLKVPVHPCLRDVHREHVLMRDAAVTGIIDASAARSENVASDLSRLLGSVLEDGGWDRALDGYSEVRPLSDDERRLVRVLDRSGVLLSGLTWIRRAAEGAAIASPRIQGRVDEIQQRLQVLADGVDGW